MHCNNIDHTAIYQVSSAGRDTISGWRALWTVGRHYSYLFLMLFFLHVHSVSFIVRNQSDSVLWLLCLQASEMLMLTEVSWHVRRFGGRANPMENTIKSVKSQKSKTSLLLPPVLKNHPKHG